MCSAPFHLRYTVKYPNASNGGFRKCCGTQSPCPSPTDDILSLRSVMREEVQDFMTHINGNIQGLSTKITNMDLNLNAINERVERCISSTAETADRITSLELKFQELSTVNNAADFPIDSCLSEVEDRVLRRKNIMIYGMNEPAQSSTLNAHESDLSSVNSLLSLLSSSIDPHNIKIRRLSTFSTSQLKPRPIKVSFPHEFYASQIRDSFLKLRKQSQLPATIAQISLAPDRTKQQQSNYQQIKKEFQTRLQNGETNIRIMYLHGSPAIVNK